MKSETLSSKIIINELDFLREQLLFNETFEKKKGFVVAWNQSNRKNLDLRSAKKHYESFIRKKNKIIKTMKNNYSVTKTFENQNIVDIKSLIIKHPKTSHKLSKTVDYKTGKVLPEPTWKSFPSRFWQKF